MCCRWFRLTVALSRHRSEACVSPSSQSFAASSSPPSRLDPGQLALVLLYGLELADRSNRRDGGGGAFHWPLYTIPSHATSFQNIVIQDAMCNVIQIENITSCNVMSCHVIEICTVMSCHAMSLKYVMSCLVLSLQ